MGFDKIWLIFEIRIEYWNQNSEKNHFNSIRDFSKIFLNTASAQFVPCFPFSAYSRSCRVSYVLEGFLVYISYCSRKSPELLQFWVWSQVKSKLRIFPQENLNDCSHWWKSWPLNCLPSFNPRVWQCVIQHLLHLRTIVSGAASCQIRVPEGKLGPIGRKNHTNKLK